MEPTNMSNLNGVVKKNKGRQKIEIKKISNKQDLQVTFSKRRNGIFKKASELSTLCGVDVAIIMFSPSNRVFSFGSPNVDSIIQRYMGRVPPLPLNVDLNEVDNTEVDNTVDERELHAHLVYLSNQIANDEKRIEDLGCLMKARNDEFWWANPIESMNNDQIKKYKKMLEDLKTKSDEKRQKLFLKSVFTHNSSQFFAGENSSSSGNGLVSVYSTPLIQNHVGATDGSIMHHHHFYKKNGQVQKDGPTFTFF